MKHVALTLGVVAVALGGCASQKQVTWESSGTPRHDHPDQGWWHYQFVYFPNAQCYFEPYSETWYWYDDGSWYAGDELPRGITPNPDIATVVHVQRDLPFTQHQPTVLSQHPWYWDLPERYDARRMTAVESDALFAAEFARSDADGRHATAPEEGTPSD